MSFPTVLTQKIISGIVNYNNRRKIVIFLNGRVYDRIWDSDNL